ncbi:hypothetical protein LOTGIDRAFT_201507 [Lottia gigantea]|uniref:Uncharacterized protein n=1 Tax=Lottia gigantea TaxID=225164 RepID=V4AVH0_LOTGI|nr:hypothetical protein LOTGIDRAFT_201507 [Lottia gigantea]ESO99030.1 hypothetical protein LOTGIDRAFT_201507 [Lottia gigantea]
MEDTQTKPRVPIAASYTSPGPRYGLPVLTGSNSHDPRSGHTKQPAFSFGVKHGKLADDCSPGPRYLPDSTITRAGKDGTPHYSLYGRHQAATMFKTPGVGSYRPEDAGPSSKFSHPTFTFGSRPRYRKSDNTPAANSYTLPGMTGSTVLSGKKQAPCYSLPGRQRVGGFSEDLAKAPGPGAYNTTDPTTFKSRAPLYSMTGRSNMPGDSTQKPGPGAHSPQNTWTHKKKNPVFSFGVRHSAFTTPLIVDVSD